MAKVLIASAMLADKEMAFLNVLRDAGLEVVYPSKRKQLNEEELMEALPGAVATLAGSENYSRRIIEAFPDLRVIARIGVGYDAVDVAAATENGVTVTVTPGANHESVAEHTFALMLALARGIVPQHSAISGGGWQRIVGVPLRDRTLGLVGLGRVGQAVAIRAVAFRMRVLAYDPMPDAAFAERNGIPLVSLERLLSESDFVSLHLPLTKATSGMIDGPALARMKPTAFLINTARGGIVHEDALVDALRAGWIAGAALDVFTEEPPPADHPLTKFENVICTAHTAGVDLQARDDMALLAARSVAALSLGNWSEANVVNPECREKFHWSSRANRKEKT